jgi:putative ubiquitin-RnfH superfamily antitoxin RatB of RatAB toxin-antitoxin module
MLQSVIEPLFSTPQFPTQFSAMGYLLGRFEALANEEVKYVIRGQLHLNDGLSFKASMRLPYWHKLSQQPTFCADDEHLWRIYFRTNEAGKLTQVQLIKCIPIDQTTKQSDVDRVETAIDLFRIRGRIADSDSQKIVLRLERNDRPPDHRENSSQWQPFFLTVWGSEPEAHKGQFWDLLVTRDGKCLKLTGATLISEAETPSIQETTKNHSVDSLHNREQRLSSSTQTIMIPGKQPEMTVKFTTRPELPEQGKTVILEVTGDNGITLRATLNRKTLAKQVQKMDSFADWVAALSGKVARLSADGTIELDAASVTVFEKKSKTTEPVSDGHRATH